MFSFANYFKKLTFARLFSLNLSNKSPWWNPVKMKFESWKTTKANLQKKLPQVSFLGISRTTTILHNFWAAILLWSYSCKKSIINHYYDEVKQRFWTKKHFIKSLLILNEKKKLLGKLEKNNYCCLNPLNTLPRKQILTQS